MEKQKTDGKTGIIDRKKIIKGLECCNYYGFHEDCPYDKKDPNEEQDTTCMMDLMRDALSLLKEQNGLMLALDQSNAANEYLNAEVERLTGLLKEQKAKTGHWVSVNDGDVVAIDNDGFPERACFCSECKKYLIASDEYAVYGRYCPFCGVKMEGR